MYLNSFNHFRAVAILFIVAGHCYVVAGLQFDTFAEQVLKNIINGGTALFVFISGFLFHHIFYKKFDYRNFIISKSKSVFIPYLLLGILPVGMFVATKVQIADGFYLPQGIGVVSEYVVPIIKYYWTGGFLDAYWYIPFVMLIFALSPLHVYFIKMTLPAQLVTVAVLCVISMLMHRPVFNLHVTQSVLYFMPVYLIGILCAIHQQTLYKRLANKDWLLLVIALGLAVLQAYFGDIGNYHKAPFEVGGIDILFIQKIFLCLFFMIWLNRFEKYENRFIKTVAATSFTIFFIHPYILFVLYQSPFAVTQIDSWLLYIAIVISMIGTSVLVALTTKKLFPNVSRFLVGY